MSSSESLNDLVKSLNSSLEYFKTKYSIFDFLVFNINELINNKLKSKLKEPKIKETIIKKLNEKLKGVLKGCNGYNDKCLLLPFEEKELENQIELFKTNYNFDDKDLKVMYDTFSIDYYVYDKLFYHNFKEVIKKNILNDDEIIYNQIKELETVLKELESKKKITITMKKFLNKNYEIEEQSNITKTKMEIKNKLDSLMKSSHLENFNLGHKKKLYKYIKTYLFDIINGFKQKGVMYRLINGEDINRNTVGYLINENCYYSKNKVKISKSELSNYKISKEDIGDITQFKDANQYDEMYKELYKQVHPDPVYIYKDYIRKYRETFYNDYEFNFYNSVLYYCIVKNKIYKNVILIDERCNNNEYEMYDIYDDVIVSLDVKNNNIINFNNDYKKLITGNKMIKIDNLRSNSMIMWFLELERNLREDKKYPINMIVNINYETEIKKFLSGVSVLNVEFSNPKEMLDDFKIIRRRKVKILEKFNVSEFKYQIYKWLIEEFKPIDISKITEKNELENDIIDNKIVIDKEIRSIDNVVCYTIVNEKVIYTFRNVGELEIDYLKSNGIKFNNLSRHYGEVKDENEFRKVCKLLFYDNEHNNRYVEGTIKAGKGELMKRDIKNVCDKNESEKDGKEGNKFKVVSKIKVDKTSDKSRNDKKDKMKEVESSGSDESEFLESSGSEDN